MNPSWEEVFSTLVRALDALDLYKGSQRRHARELSPVACARRLRAVRLAQERLLEWENIYVQDRR